MSAEGTRGATFGGIKGVVTVGVAAAIGMAAGYIGLAFHIGIAALLFVVGLALGARYLLGLYSSLHVVGSGLLILSALVAASPIAFHLGEAPPGVRTLVGHEGMLFAYYGSFMLFIVAALPIAVVGYLLKTMEEKKRAREQRPF